MMKKIILLFFVLSFTIQAQETKQRLFNFRYVGLTLEGDDYIGTGIDLNCIYKDKTSLALGCIEGFYESKDYDSDDGYIHGDYSTHIYLTVGRIIKIKRYNRLRLNLSAGLTYNINDYVNNDFVESNQGSYGSDFYTKASNNVGFILNPKLEIPLLSWIGFQLSPKVVLNKTKSFYGLGFGLMFGKLYSSPLRAKAQEEKFDLGLVYLTGALEVGNYFGLSTELNYIHKENISFSVGWMGNSYRNKNYPSDYIDDSDIISFFPEREGSSHTYLTVGKIIKMKNLDYLRFNLAGGLAISNYSVEENFVREEQVRDGYYYSSDYNQYTKIGLILNPRLEILVSSWVGFQISPKVILNTQKNFYGISFGLMLGKTKNRRF